MDRTKNPQSGIIEYPQTLVTDTQRQVLGQFVGVGGNPGRGFSQFFFQCFENFQDVHDIVVEIRILCQLVAQDGIQNGFANRDPVFQHGPADLLEKVLIVLIRLAFLLQVFLDLQKRFRLMQLSKTSSLRRLLKLEFVDLVGLRVCPFEGVR